MASRDRTFTVKLKQAIDLVDFVSETVPLKRSGKYFTGLSPFTKEKTPSFFVNPEKQTFHCYSTDQGGDIIDFTMLTKGFSFVEALEFLSAKAGIPMEASHKSPEQLAREREEDEERKLFWKLNRFAARFYQETLNAPEGALARDYVAKRGIAPESVLGFALGYAPDSWTALRDYFLRIKAPLLKAHELGLFRTRGGEKPKADGSNLFDTFRNRLIFPIRDSNGEVVGFGGRWLGPSSAEAPKYLNSPESTVYEKEKVLYNLDQARKSIRDLETVVLVEGYMDCLALVQAGFPNVVANCGTALTKTQASLLKKMANRVICLYDSDAAGRAATERAMDIFLETEGAPLLGAQLSEGKDPDEFLRSRGEGGKLEMAEILQNSPAILDIWAEARVREAPPTIQGRTEAVEKIAQKLSKLRDELWIQARIPGIAKALELSPDLVVNAIRKFRKNFAGGAAAAPPAKSAPIPPRKIPESNLVRGGKIKQIQGQSGKRNLGFEWRFLRDLVKHPPWIQALRERQSKDPAAVLPLVEDAGIRAVLAKWLEPLRADEEEAERVQEVLDFVRENPSLRNVLSEAMMMKAEEALPDTELDVALARLQDEKKRRQENLLQEQIDEAEQRGDAAASGALLLQLLELRRQRVTR